MARRRAQRVSLRVKVVERRRKNAARLFLAGVAALALVFGAKRLDPTNRARTMLASLWTVSRFDVSGVAEPARGAVATYIRPLGGRTVGPFELRRQEAGLKDRFPYLADVRVRLLPWSRTLAVSARLKVPVARCGEGKWLAEDGGLFAAPPGLYAGELPELVQPGKGANPDMAGLAGFLADVKDRLRVRSVWFGGSDGWNLRLEDGTVLLWGGLDGTPVKLARLDQVMSDARRRFRAVSTVNLRYAMDGRVLVQPAR